MLHWMAWERGCKSLYYLRSKSVQRAAHAGGEGIAHIEIPDAGKTDYEECLACQ
jgi:ribonucleoside-diphosphate reductase alpha chain